MYLHLPPRVGVHRVGCAAILKALSCSPGARQALGNYIYYVLKQQLPFFLLVLASPGSCPSSAQLGSWGHLNNIARGFLSILHNEPSKACLSKIRAPERSLLFSRAVFNPVQRAEATLGQVLYCSSPLWLGGSQPPHLTHSLLPPTGPCDGCSSQGRAGW